MNEIRRKKRSKKRGKSKNKEFMDAALDAFIRDQSLKKWREIEGLREEAKIKIIKQGGAKGTASISSSRLNPYIFKNSFFMYFSICNTI